MGPCGEGMALIPGGKFRGLKARRGTEVGVFCLDRREVTVEDYEGCVKRGQCAPECLKEGTCRASPTRADWGDAAASQRASAFCNGPNPERRGHPINCVSRAEAQQFCGALGKRLPTGIEWEWASRGASPKRPFPWGVGAPTGLQLCWGHPLRRDGTCVPGSLATDTTPQGVSDLAGNVAEWVAPGGTAAIFGASWHDMDDGYVRGALGGVDSPAPRSEVVGFRCASAAAQGG